MGLSGGSSYELRVGSYLELGAGEDGRIILPDGDAIALAPGGFVLIGTREELDIPNDILGMLYLRSTYARNGLVSWFQGVVDPGYRGGLTVVLHNLGNELVPIYGGERICHLVLEQLAEPVDKGYEGRYQDKPGATPAQRTKTLRVVSRSAIVGLGKSLGEGMSNALAAELLREMRRLLGGPSS